MQRPSISSPALDRFRASRGAPQQTGSNQSYATNYPGRLGSGYSPVSNPPPPTVAPKTTSAPSQAVPTGKLPQGYVDPGLQRLTQGRESEGNIVGRLNNIMAGLRDLIPKKSDPVDTGLSLLMQKGPERRSEILDSFGSQAQQTTQIPDFVRRALISAVGSKAAEITREPNTEVSSLLERVFSNTMNKTTNSVESILGNMLPSSFMPFKDNVSTPTINNINSFGWQPFNSAETGMPTVETSLPMEKPISHNLTQMGKEMPVRELEQMSAQGFRDNSFSAQPLVHPNVLQYMNAIDSTDHLNYRTSDPFGTPRPNRDITVHHGIDLLPYTWDGFSKAPVVSTTPGTVTFNGYNGSGGYAVAIVDETGRYTHVYQHMAEPSLLRIGDNVKPWDFIGNMGNSGSTYGSGGGVHLDYQVWDNHTQTIVDPYNFAAGIYFGRDPQYSSADGFSPQFRPPGGWYE